MDKTSLKLKWDSLNPLLDERARRLWAATEASTLGRGGVTLVAEVTGLSRMTIHSGIKDVQKVRNGQAPAPMDGGRVRAVGSGRKRLAIKDATLLGDLEFLVEPATKGDPMSPLGWTSKSTMQLAQALQQRGHKVSARTVAALLIDQGYSLQANRKSKEAEIHPDRDRQFAHINDQTKTFQKEGQPVISVDTKKKELIGEFKNGGREWQPKGKPEHISDHDFPDREMPKAVPYGIYDVAANQGWVTVGTDHDTPEFAVNSIRTWWTQMGKPMYPKATRLLVMADCGGSNGNRSRTWKVNLQKLADETGLEISVSHFPPGTSKWNKIEHRMFCHITQNWRGRPLVSLEVVVNLIGNVTTRKGLKVRAALDPGKYEIGTKVPNHELDLVRLKRSEFQGAWNYAILPH